MTANMASSRFLGRTDSYLEGCDEEESERLIISLSREYTLAHGQFLEENLHHDYSQNLLILYGLA